MRFSSQEEIQDSNVPMNTSSRTSITGNIQYRRSSKETIRSYQGSISNSSVHTTSTTTTHEDLFGPSGQGPDQNLPIPDHKSSHSLEKLTFGDRNQSLSTVYTIREPESDRSSIETSTPTQELRLLSLPSLENEAASSLPSTPRSSAYIPGTDPGPNLRSNFGVTHSIPSDDLLTKPYGDSQPSAIMETFKTDKAPAPRPAPPLPYPIDRLGTTSHSRSATATVKGKKGVRGFMTDFLNSNKRRHISTPYDPVHLTHVGFNSSTREFTGLPNGWQQPLQDMGISKSDQEKYPLAVIEIVKFYQEGGGDVWDKMGYAPAPGSSSQSPPIPGTAQPAFPGLSKSVDDSFVSTVSVPFIHSLPNLDRSNSQRTLTKPVAERRPPRPPTAPQQQSAAVESLAKTAGATPRRRGKKKEDKENDADIVKRLQQICTDADPTRLYRNLVKIGQG
jgi:p21-activated kinase 1